MSALDAAAKRAKLRMAFQAFTDEVVAILVPDEEPVTPATSSPRVHAVRPAHEPKTDDITRAAAARAAKAAGYYPRGNR